jgi:hypothetical protein
MGGKEIIYLDKATDSGAELLTICILNRILCP